MNQPSFFEQTQYGTFEPVRPYAGHAPYADGSATSIEAAKDINDNDKLGEWQKKVLLSLVHPASDEKLEWRLGCQRTRTSRPRRRELELAGYVEDSGQRVESDFSGKWVTVWRLTPKGESAVAALKLSPSSLSKDTDLQAAAGAASEEQRIG